MQRGKADQLRANERRKQNNLPVGSRLFITFSRRLSQEMLWKIFARYGPLENVYLRDLPANYGYAKYASARGAQFAMKALNGRIVEGSECCISLALPQKKDGGEQAAPLPAPLPADLPYPPMHVEYPLKEPSLAPPAPAANHAAATGYPGTRTQYTPAQPDFDGPRDGEQWAGHGGPPMGTGGYPAEPLPAADLGMEMEGGRWGLTASR